MLTSESGLLPELFYSLSDHDPHALARALACYDAQGVAALSYQCAAWIFQRDGVSLTPLFLRLAWVKRGLITEVQAGVSREAVA
jgi:hypothetical protein